MRAAGPSPLGAVMMMGMGFVGVVESPYAAIALLSLGGFAHQTLSVTVITMSSDLFKRSEVATVAGMAGHVRQRGAADLLAADRRPGRHRRLHAVLRRARRARPGRRGPALDAGARASSRGRTEPSHAMSAPSSATRSCAASTPTRRSCASATTTTSRPRRSSGFPASRSTIRATSCTGGC